MNSKSKDTFTGGEIIESDDVWIINSIDWNGTGFRYGIFFEKDLGVLTQKALLGFASGVMIAAGVWSLIMPSIEMAEEQGTIPWLPAAVGFLLGITFLLALDTLIPHLHVNDEKPEGPASNLKKSTMLVLAVTLHNIPEGMAVGVVFAGAMMENSTVSMAGAIALAIGIAHFKISRKAQSFRCH